MQNTTLFQKFLVALTLLFLMFSIKLTAQVKVSDDLAAPNAPHPSAVLEAYSVDRGFLPPRLTTIQRDAIANTAEGLTIFNTDDNCINVFQNSRWTTYCSLRFSSTCGCVEYLTDYGLTTEAWVPVAPPASSADSDWFEVGSTTEPGAITDDVYTEGRVTIGGQVNNLARFNVYGNNAETNSAAYLELTGIGTTNPNQTLTLHQNVPTSGDKKGIENTIVGSSFGNVFMVYNDLIQTSNSTKYGFYNNFAPTTDGAQSGVYNAFKSTGGATKYGVQTQFDTLSSGTSYGIRNDFDNTNTSVKYGVYNDFNSIAGGSKYGVRNVFSSNSTTGVVYGVSNSIFSDGPSTKYGIFNSLSGIDDGITYGTRNNVSTNGSNPDNSYGTYNSVTGSGTGTKYAGYFSTSGADNYGVYSVNTTSNGYAGAFRGDVEIGDGFLVVGDGNIGSNPEANSITRYGVWEGEFSTSISFDTDGYRYFNLGNVDLPSNVPTSVTATKIVWEVDGYHEDANEDHGVWIALEGTTYTGTTGWYGWFGNASNGAKDVNWQYVSNPLSVSMTNTQNLRLRVEDEDCTLCGGDDMRVFNMAVKIYYTYTRALQEGEIAASGLIYSNTDSQVGDLAEHFEVNNDHGIETGLIVTFKPGTDNEYEVATRPYSNHIVGVISENPSVVLNNPRVGPAIALAGRVKVKLTQNAGELIKSGDFLTTSEVPGKAMKATKLGRVVGYAVTNQKPGTDYVEILVQPGFHLPEENTRTEKEKPTGRKRD